MRRSPAPSGSRACRRPYRADPYAWIRPADTTARGRGDAEAGPDGCIIGRMAFASPAISAPRRPRPLLADVPPGLTPAQVRDELTCKRLLAVVQHLPGLTVEAYDRAWWDGQAHVACLVVRGGRRMRRLRIVETEGQCLVVPFSRRLAHRWLAARRRARGAGLAPGAPRARARRRPPHAG